MTPKLRSTPRKPPRKPKSRAGVEYKRGLEFRQKPFGKKGRRDLYTLK